MLLESIGTMGLIIGVIVLLIITLYFVPIGLWFSALVSGVRISLLQLFLMRFRKVPPGVIVRALIEGTKADVPLSRDALEAHYLAGGHVANVVHALVSASKANIELPFNMATAIDLAGRDVFEAVQMSVNPKVINTPPVTAVANQDFGSSCSVPPAESNRVGHHLPLSHCHCIILQHAQWYFPTPGCCPPTAVSSTVA